MTDIQQEDMERQLEEVEEEIDVMEREIDNIAIQLDTAEARIAQGDHVDSDWFHRATKAIKMKRREVGRKSFKAAKMRRALRKQKYEQGGGSFFSQYFRVGERRLDPQVHEEFCQEAREEAMRDAEDTP